MNYIVIPIERPAEVSFLPVNATGVRISWSGSMHLPTSIHYTVSLSTNGVIISQYDRVYPPGTASDVVVLDDDITLTNAYYVHNFTLYYIIGNDVTLVQGPPTNVPFAFGMQPRTLPHTFHIFNSCVSQIKRLFKFSLDLFNTVWTGE